MTPLELKEFLLDNNLSLTDCKDINDRRQKAKRAFVFPAKLPESEASSSHRFAKDDVVILTGLSRVGMNGKKGTVVFVNHVEGKAVVRVEEIFKIKLVNLKKPGDDLEELE